MKKIFSLLVALALVCSLAVTALANEVTAMIINTGTTQAFTAEAVSEEDLHTILEAGLSATSAINQQPWYFVAVTNQEAMQEISGSMSFGGGAPAGMQGTPPAGGVPEGGVADIPAGGAVEAPAVPVASTSAKASLGDSPVAIIIYMDESTASTNASFDCGLACQNMVIAANALGYGTKIVSSPTMALNGESHDALCEKLGVNVSFSAVAVLLIGYADDDVDGVSSASTRNQMGEKVSFVK